MASISRDTLRTTIRNRGDYNNTRRFPDAYLNTEIQSAFGKFYQLVADVHEGYWDTEGSVSTVNGTAYVALPTDCWRVQAVDRLDGSDYREMAQVGLESRNRYGSTRAQPVAYRLSSRGIELLPTPNGVYSLRVMYTPVAPTLGSAREWYNGWEDYVIEAVLLELDKQTGKPTVGERMAALEKAEQVIKAGASQRRSQEPEYLNLREYGGLDPYDDGIF